MSFKTEVLGTSSNAHTYRLLIFKEPLHQDKALCLSAAEKRDYLVFPMNRQASCFFFLASLLALRCEGQNYSEPAAGAQG
ncbi:hypothetical protein [Massilia sp. erpn]|uniref:hypothetical protein n=1 Tax=Massilia sp. erpn TaxID=2738142 RepID=UPI0021047FBE|nr:hypothetical protein [Massilia sp. erpn]UTY57480.1 hypothetical protein HPQ68_09925 [Massilia sp. erpn]